MQRAIYDILRELEVAASGNSASAEHPGRRYHRAAGRTSDDEHPVASYGLGRRERNAVHGVTRGRTNQHHGPVRRRRDERVAPSPANSRGPRFGDERDGRRDGGDAFREEIRHAPQLTLLRELLQAGRFARWRRSGDVCAEETVPNDDADRQDEERGERQRSEVLSVHATLGPARVWPSWNSPLQALARAR